jgi:Immunoglobulin domain
MRNLLLFGVFLVCASQSSMAALQIVRQPQHQIVWLGGQASFSVAARGAKKITYQWQKDGVILPGQTKSTLRIKKTTPNDRGVYTVRVSDGSGTLTSKQGYLFSMGRYIQESENFNDPSSTKGLLVGGEYGDLYPEISADKVSFKYFSGIPDQGDDCFWFWNQSPQRKQSFDVRIDGNDSTSGKLQFIAACLPTGLGYRIERNGREGNFNAGSGGDDGSVPRNYYYTSSTQFSFRLVYDAVSKVRTLKAYYDVDGPLNGENWTLLQTVRNPNFITGRPVLIGVCYNNNESGDALDGNNVTADNFQAR